MYIQHGWNAHFQDEVLTTMEDDGISILCWMFVSMIFNSVGSPFQSTLVGISFQCNSLGIIFLNISVGISFQKTRLGISVQSNIVGNINENVPKKACSCDL